MLQDKKKLRRADWFDYIDQQEKSGISQAEFCKQQQLSICQFSYYRSLYVKSRNTQKTAPSFSAIAIKQKPSMNIDQISIELPNGFCCHVGLRISVETDSRFGLQVDSDSGNIRTLITVYADTLSSSRRIIC